MTDRDIERLLYTAPEEVPPCPGGDITWRTAAVACGLAVSVLACGVWMFSAAPPAHAYQSYAGEWGAGDDPWDCFKCHYYEDPHEPTYDPQYPYPWSTPIDPMVPLVPLYDDEPTASPSDWPDP